MPKELLFVGLDVHARIITAAVTVRLADAVLLGSAAAHKLARILHHLIKHRVPTDASVFAAEEELHRLRCEKYLHKQAAGAFGFQLTLIQSNG